MVKKRGRDILPWLKLANELSMYDIVGHFHSKKSPTDDEWVGDSWQQKIYDSIIVTISEVFNEFLNDTTMGIIIPPIPDCFLPKPLVEHWGNNLKICDTLYKKLNCGKSIDFSQVRYPIMPYATMFWYWPDALKTLFDLGLTEDDFPNEPLQVDGTIDHAIERLLVYIAWSERYDFRVAVNKFNVINEFDYLELQREIGPEILFVRNV